MLVGVRVDAKYFSVLQVAKHTSWNATTVARQTFVQQTNKQTNKQTGTM
jgi:hypothetical protein